MNRPTAVRLTGFSVVALALWFLPTLQGPLGFPIFYLLFGYTLLFWFTQASSWNMFTGFSGYFSFGQGAFFGVGVYTTGVLASKQGWPLIAAIPVAGVLAAVLGLSLGFVVFRLRRLQGEIFALVTLAVAFVVAAIARISSTIDGGSGIALNNVQLPEFLGAYPSMMFRLGLIIATLTIFAAATIQHSRLGWGLFSINDDEAVAESLGVPTFRHKMMAFGLSAFFGGLSGAVHAIQISYITIEDVFSIRIPLFVIVMSVLGGMRHWMGPIIGATIIHTLTDRLNRASDLDLFGGNVTVSLDHLNDIIIGLLLIVMVLAVKDGLWPRLVRRKWAGAGAFIVGILVARFWAPEMSLIGQFVAGELGAVVILLPSSDIIDRWRNRRAPSGSPDEPSDQPHVGAAR
ncbi:MAG: branched-chain amino acid ABC transporter permease [Acidimicrobiia bacterium]|nr:branched-chain amino acid ABC transporter permease [Acidimicrobiia bacterium]